MNLKTILFKLGLRKLRNKDVVTVKEDGIEKTFLVIGKQFNIKKDQYNRQESKGRIAVEYRKGFEVIDEACKLFYIDKSYIDKKKFGLIATKDIVSVR